MTEFIRLNWNDGGHTYSLDDKPLFGVTSILSRTRHPDELARLNKAIHATDGKRKMKPVDREAAMLRGRICHEQIEKFFAEESFNPNEYVLPLLQFFLQSGINSDWVLCEESIYNREASYPYAGTVDLVAFYRGKLTVFDWTTSDRFYRKDWLIDKFTQCAAYSLALRNAHYGDEFLEISQITVAVLRKGKFQLFDDPLENYIPLWQKRLDAFAKMKEWNDAGVSWENCRLRYYNTFGG